MKIFWTKTSKENLFDIYWYYKINISVEVAIKIKEEILTAPKRIDFSEQFQRDEYAKTYRRIIVRHYKILYSVKNGSIYIHRIFDCRQDPSKLRL